MTVPTGPSGARGTDFAALRAEGVGLLQALSADSWTDFNDSDPGVTLLEALCYAITDLSYRAGHSVPDLLAEAGRDVTFPSAAQVLTSGPVTAADYRRLVLDVDGVRNAWVEPVELVSPQLHYAAGTRQLLFRPDPPTTEPVVLRGLYRVLVEASEAAPRDLSTRVASRLHDWRNAGEDFAEIRVLAPLPVRLTATLEIDVPDRPADVLIDVYDIAAEYFSPTLSFHTLPEMLAAGYRSDEVFDGPLLEHGFLDPAELAAHQRRATARSSDLIAAIAGVPGVRDVQSFRMAAGSTADDWALPLDPELAPRLDLAGTDIRLVRGQSPVDVDGSAVAAAVTARRLQAEQAAHRPLPVGLRDRPVPTGRSRGIARYRSVQHELPTVYGVGEYGLATDAPAARRAAAHQLQAYLLLFDQLLAGTAAQLASVADLLSSSDAPGTYVTQVPDPGPWTEQVLADPASYGEEIQALTAATAGDPPYDRRNRFLSHLLARQGEEFPEYGSAPERTAASKSLLLSELPLLSARRATGVDYLLAAVTPEESGLEARVARKLGLVAEDGEVLLLVEHLLLRPTARDDRKDGLPLLEQTERDPYSLQLTFLLPQTTARFAPGSPFRDVVEQVLRAEAPAHLKVYVRWLDDAAFAAARRAHDRFLTERFRQWRQDLGLDRQPT